MSESFRWQPCIHHRGRDAHEFVHEFFAQAERRVLIVGGAGFDPRSHFVAEQLAASCRDRVSGLFIREERPDATESLRQLAEANDVRIRELIESVEIFQVDVIDRDNAPVGGRRATKLLDEKFNLDGITDLILDCSALSVSVMFPIARYCLNAVERAGSETNFHILVLDDPETDSAIRSTSSGMAAPLHTFSGGLNLDSNTDAARLWLPQLGTARRDVLHLIHQHVDPHAVCPIIPFPSILPRTGDELIEEYGDLFETTTGAMTRSWHVDSRDLVYAHEKSPLDLYRSILRIDDARKRVFSQTGGSQLILSPLGSKAVAIGILMAALERGFAVVSVESIEYLFEPETNGVAPSSTPELVHIWLHGQAYRHDEAQQDAGK